MTFKQIKAGRVFLAVFAIAVISMVVLVALYTGYMISQVWDTLIGLDPDLSQAEQNEILMDELEQVNSDISGNPGRLDNLMIVHWVITAIMTFITALWTARRSAINAPQAVGYGVAIGAVTMLFYGLCAFNSSINVVIQFAMLLSLAGVAGLAGQMASGSLKNRPSSAYSSGGPNLAPNQMPPGMLYGQPGGDADVYYNMGVTAAMGGRREEARQHFTRALQYYPRNIAAWLQLANLADTPVDAWEYIQQARAINPSDPSVVQAANIIWPQVKGQISDTAPSNQAPYRGGAMDDSAIPRTTLPAQPEPTELDDILSPGGDDEPPII